MGIGVSNWKLARAVSRAGQLGVVSGTAVNTILVRRLQDGDKDGAMRRALAACPLRDAATRVQERYFIEGGKAADEPYRLAPMYRIDASPELTELTLVANFVEVYLAKENHTGLVGLNLLEKVQLPTLSSLFGAMLAGVDYVLMGAGIPRLIPGVLDAFAQGKPAELKIAVEGATAGREHAVRFDPSEWLGGCSIGLKRPLFLAIVSSFVLAATLAKKANGHVDGFVVEGVSAGGHNAPPRGPLQLNERGEPLYGARDVADLKAIAGLGRPYWVAGSYAEPQRFRAALAEGAAGVQIGTAFAFCEESGLDPKLKALVLQHSEAGTLDLLTDPRASPTGMPFKVAGVDGTVADPAVYAKRERRCDLGYLRQPYEKPDGTVGYRCPAEPEADYVRKGGVLADAEGRKCLCNGLVSAIDLAQSLKGGGLEPAIITAGEDVRGVHRFCPPGRKSYTAADVLQTVLG